MTTKRARLLRIAARLRTAARLEKLAQIPPAQVKSLIETRLVPKHEEVLNQLDKAFGLHVSIMNAVSTLGQRSNDAKMAELGKNRAGRAQALQRKIKEIFGGDLSGLSGAQE